MGFISAASNRQKKNENTTLEDWAAELEQELLALENYATRNSAIPSSNPPKTNTHWLGQLTAPVSKYVLDFEAFATEILG
ncbi:MAG: hypothetical protein WBP03_02155 [Candidatus Saccharimonadales bacterium]